MLGQSFAGLDGPTSRQQVVHQQDATTWWQRINMHFERVCSIFQIVVETASLKRQFAWFTDRDKRNAQFQCQGSTENKTSRFGGQNCGGLNRAEVLGKLASAEVRAQ